MYAGATAGIMEEGGEALLRSVKMARRNVINKNCNVTSAVLTTPHLRPVDCISPSAPPRFSQQLASRIMDAAHPSITYLRP